MTSNYADGTTEDLIDERNERLRLFLLEQVSSYEELETLLFLARNAGREFSDAEVAATLRVPVGSIDEALQGLAAVGGLIELTERSGILLYRYAPRDESRHERVVELQEAYEDRRLSVVQIMSANALERVRGAAMRRLADAFRIKGGK